MKKYLLILFIACLMLVGTASADTLIQNVVHDGYVMEGTDAVWATIARDAGDYVVDNGIRIYAASLATTTSNVQTYHRRAIVVFNGSTIPDDATIDSVKVSVYGYTKTNAQGTVNASLIDTNPANPMDFVAGDYDATTFTRQANDIAYASVSTTAYNNWTLTNLTGVSKTGLFSYMLTHSADVDLSALTWASAVGSGFTYVATDTGANPPFITIEWTAGGAPDTTPPASITNLANVTTCNSVNFTWTNPADADFNGTMNWFNGAAQSNLTKTDTFKLFSGLAENTAYTFSTKTFDTTGNVNTTFVNLTSTTSTCPLAPVASFVITLTDTSTNTPTSWQWNATNLLGNNTEVTFSTAQNPTMNFGIGNYLIKLTATNAVGSSSTTKNIGLDLSSPKVYFWNRTG
jgi:hypothetical protein